MWKVIISLFVVLQFGYAEKDFTEKSKKALDGIVKKQIEKMSNLANSTKSANEKNVKGYVLSSHIRAFSDIDAHIKSEINSMREDIKGLIIRIASEIEVNNDSSGKLSIDDRGNVYYHSDKRLAKDIKDKEEKLLKANLQNSVSVRSIELAIRLLANINSELIQQGRNAKTGKEKEKIYMKQAIYVYEMSDMLLELLDKVSLDGVGVIYSIYEQAKLRVDGHLKDIQRDIKEVDILVKDNLMTLENAEKEKLRLNTNKKGVLKSLNIWKDILKKVSNQESFLSRLKQHKRLITYKRNTALSQLEILRDIRTLKEIKNTIGSFDKLVDSVSSLELLTIDEYTLQQLLGNSE